MKEPESLQQVGRTRVLFKKRKYSYFAGCDYFRLSSHPEILRAIGAGLKKYGLNVAASRVTTGNHALYGELESALAKFFRVPAALLLSNGYSSNAVVAQTLRGEFSHVIIDTRAHVSLRDASRLFDCPVLDFKTRDPADLRRVLAKAGRNANPIILTEGVFTYESEIAPLGEYVKILKSLGARGRILLDDAHGAGVIGKTGRGSPEHAGIPRADRERIIQTVTLSKAFGVYGGAVLCPRALREKMFARSTMFAGGTPLPLPLAYADLHSLRLLDEDPGFLERLNGNVAFVKNSLRAAGFPTPATPVPVVAVTPSNSAHASAIRRRLLGRGIFPSFIQYPGGPPGGYLRLVISSEHSKEQLEDLVAAII